MLFYAENQMTRRSHNIIFSEKGFATAYTVQSQFYSLNTTALKTVKLNMPKCVIARNAAIFFKPLCTALIFQNFY